MPNLGRLEEVEVRSEWENEARDFTPWLAEESLDLLEDTIGIELELEATEKDVGKYNADILCKETVENRWVVIENQLEQTNHRHLGQLLTYASGLDAVTIVWISDSFNDQHRSALDWLNNITEEGIHFFGLEIELWKIEGSPPAPKFNIVSKPNNWSDTVSSSAQSEELSETKELQREYWTSLKEHLESQGSRVQPRKPKPHSWARYSVGRTKCRLTARISSRTERIAVELTLTDDTEAEPLYYLLQEDQDAIEEEIGRPLEWKPKPGKKRFVVTREWSADPSDREDWPNQHRDLAETLDAFHQAFSPRLRDLDPEDWTKDSSDASVEKPNARNGEAETDRL